MQAHRQGREPLTNKKTLTNLQSLSLAGNRVADVADFDRLFPLPFLSLARLKKDLRPRRPAILIREKLFFFCRVLDHRN